MYSVHLQSGARHGETPRIGGNPKNQPTSELDIFSKRQVLSRAVVVNSNMSRGKYLAREGPGSRLQGVYREMGCNHGNSESKPSLWVVLLWYDSAQKVFLDRYRAVDRYSGRDQGTACVCMRACGCVWISGQVL